MQTDTIRGTYGSGYTPCSIFTAFDGMLTWYCVEGSQNVNAVIGHIEDGADVETLPDVDGFTWVEPISFEEDLQPAVEA